MAAFPEDRIEKSYQNYMSNDTRGITVSYRGRVTLAYSASGRLYSFGIQRPTQDVAPNLTLEQCVAKVREWYQEVGGHHPLVLGRAEPELGVPPEDRQQFYHVFMHYTAENSPYRFASGVEAIMERTYGTPEGLWMGGRPPYDAPRQVVPKETAVTNAIAAASENTGWAQLEGASQDAMFAVPAYSHLPNRLRQAHRDRMTQGRAELIYEVTVRDGSFLPSEESPQPFVQVYVDAETGEPIAVLPAYRYQGSKPPVAQQFSWGSAKWSVGTAKGKVTPVSGARITNSATKVILRQGRKALIVCASSDGKRVWITDGDKVRIGQPDEALRRGILSSRAIRTFPMNPPDKAKVSGANGKE